MNVKAPICENKCLLNLKKLKKMKTLILKKFISTFKVDVSNIDTSFLKENEFYQTQLENSFKYFSISNGELFFHADVPWHEKEIIHIMFDAPKETIWALLEGEPKIVNIFKGTKLTTQGHFILPIPMDNIKKVGNFYEIYIQDWDIRIVNTIPFIPWKETKKPKTFQIKGLFNESSRNFYLVREEYCSSILEFQLSKYKNFKIKTIKLDYKRLF